MYFNLILREQEDISYTGFIDVQWNWRNSVCDSLIHTCFSETQDN